MKNKDKYPDIEAAKMAYLSEACNPNDNFGQVCSFETWLFAEDITDDTDEEVGTMTEEEFNKKYHVRHSDCCHSCKFFMPDSYEPEGMCLHKDSKGEVINVDYMVCDEFKER